MAPDTLFFYTIEHIKIKDGSKMIFAEEKGIGKIKIKRKRYFLERETFHYQMGFRDLTSQDGLLYFDDETYLVVGTYVPSSHNEVYAIPHSVAYTGDEPFSPHILQLDNECVLGRLDDEIQSIDKNELKQILGYEDPLETLLTYNGPLILNTKFLELIGKKSMILSDQVALKPQKIRPREKQAGSIIFNEKKNRFEGFDGTKWRPLQWGDE